MSAASLLLAPAVAIAGAVAAEIAARSWLALRGRYYVWTPSSRMRMELERESLPMLPPVVRFDVNKDGERGAEPPASWHDAYRVLVVGGSAAECYYLDQEATWPEVIRRELARPDALARLGAAAVHVGNVGRSLVGCEHIRILLERILPRYARLDAIVLMVGASDLVFWLERGTPERLADEPLPTQRLFANHPEGPFGWGPRTLALRRLASYWNHRLRRPVVVRTRTGKRLIDLRRMRRDAPELVGAVPDPAPMLDHFERHYRELLRLAASRARRVIVARQPWFEKDYTPEEARWMWQFGRGRPYEETVTTYYDHALVWQMMRRIDQRAAEIAHELGLEEIDLMAVLGRDLDTYYDEMHHTPKGCAAIGKAVAQKVLEGEDRALSRAPGSARRAPSPGVPGARTGRR